MPDRRRLSRPALVLGGAVGTPGGARVFTPRFEAPVYGALAATVLRVIAGAADQAALPPSCRAIGRGRKSPRSSAPDMIEHTPQTIINLESILAAAGCQDVIKATDYLTEMADYPRVNKVWRGDGAEQADRNLRCRIRAAGARAHEDRSGCLSRQVGVAGTLRERRHVSSFKPLRSRLCCPTGNLLRQDYSVTTRSSHSRRSRSGSGPANNPNSPPPALPERRHSARPCLQRNRGR